jgi:glutamate dehydrogenase/leucine dehydrogenase
LNEVGTKYNAQIFRGDDLYSADVDIYAPCAMGATINNELKRRKTHKDTDNFLVTVGRIVRNTQN